MTLTFYHIIAHLSIFIHVYFTMGVIKIHDYKIFRAEVDKFKRLHGVTNSDIAKSTGYSLSAILKFMGEKTDYNSAKVAKAISEAYNIPLE